MSALPELTSEQVNELIRESAGRAVSYVDAPEWYCGQRKCTAMMRDGMDSPEGYMCPGSSHSLAYSLLDHVREYQRLQDSIQHNRRLITQLDAELEAEYKRKQPRKRHLANLAQDRRIAYQDVRNCEQRIAELIAKYFRGFEGRLLIQKSEDTK